MRGPLALGLLCGLALACRGPNPESARSGPGATPAPAPAVLDATLDRVEERLLAGQATVALWRELRERHEGVAAVACTTLERQVRGMELVAARDAAVRPAKRIRLAARGGPREPVSGHVAARSTAAGAPAPAVGEAAAAAGTGSASAP